MKVLVAVVLLCALVLKTSCKEIQAEAEHDREKRWELPSIDVSFSDFYTSNIKHSAPFRIIKLTSVSTMERCVQTK